jgi:hypothetical protein
VYFREAARAIITDLVNHEVARDAVAGVIFGKLSAKASPREAQGKVLPYREILSITNRSPGFAGCVSLTAGS